MEQVEKKAVETSTCAARRRVMIQSRGGLVALLKMERVRWHPDGMGQRLSAVGAGGLEEEVKGKVEEVFGIVWGFLGKLVGEEERSAGLR